MMQRYSAFESTKGRRDWCRKARRPECQTRTNTGRMKGYVMYHKGDIPTPIGVRVLSPTPGSPARGSGIGKMSSKSSCLWKQVELELHRNGGNRESTFEGCTQVFRGTGTYSKAATPQEPGTDLPAGLGRSPGGVEVHCGSQLKQED